MTRYLGQDMAVNRSAAVIIRSRTGARFCSMQVEISEKTTCVIRFPDIAGEGSCQKPS